MAITVFNTKYVPARKKNHVRYHLLPYQYYVTYTNQKFYTCEVVVVVDDIKFFYYWPSFGTLISNRKKKLGKITTFLVCSAPFMLILEILEFDRKKVEYDKYELILATP